MREKLIQLLCEGFQTDCCIAHCNHPPCGDVLVVADHLIANGVTVQRWIPVTEKLPTEEDARGNIGFVVAVNKHDEWAKLWWWELVVKYSQEFTHWMPLPTPPKDGDSE